jgi:FkbM family methyltransferase
MASPLAYRLRNTVRLTGFEIVRTAPDGNMLASHLHELLNLYRINCVFDVGARQGEFGRWLRGTGYRGRIVSFEPVRDNVRHLRASAARDPSWVVEPYALGATEGRATINVTNFTHFSSFRVPGSLAAELYAEESRVTSTEEVEVHRLADVFGDVTSGIAEPRVYLKMDTQGFDLEVLRGAREALPKVIALQSEMAIHPLYEDNPTFDQAWPEIASYGYSLSGMFPVSLDPRLRMLEFDCVAVRDESAAGLG